MKTILLSAILLSSFALAAETTIGMVHNPYVQVECNSEELATIGLTTEEVSVTDLADSITIKAKKAMVLCSKDAGNFSWLKVDPFKGFLVPYFDNRTNSMKNRFEVIASSAKGNRVDLILEQGAQSAIAKMGPAGDGSIIGEVSLSKKNLFTKEELKQLQNGMTVKKSFALSSTSQMTTYIDGEVFTNSVGDMIWEGQNVELNFTQDANGLVSVLN